MIQYFDYSLTESIYSEYEERLISVKSDNIKILYDYGILCGILRSCILHY